MSWLNKLGFGLQKSSNKISSGIKSIFTTQKLASSTIEELEELLKEVLSSEDVDEKYVRDFLSCSMIDRNSKNFEIDKILFTYKYGSNKAKKIAVDEKLKMI